MRTDLTVIYYTSNMEEPNFEARIRQNLLDTIGDLPLVSVSQKPIDFGHNICVGQVGPSYQNAFRQMQIGAMAAKTRFICTAESDMIYPPEYFQFVPPRDDIYYVSMPLWVLFVQRRKAKIFARKPRGSESAMVVGREHFIRGIEKLLAPRGTTWSAPNESGEGLSFLLASRRGRGSFITSIPTITFKTDYQMHRKTPHDVSSYCRELPGIGTTHELIRRFM